MFRRFLIFKSTFAGILYTLIDFLYSGEVLQSNNQLVFACFNTNERVGKYGQVLIGKDESTFYVCQKVCQKYAFFLKIQLFLGRIL